MLRDCPYCAEKIQKRAKVCRFCGAKVQPIYVDKPDANRQIARIIDLAQEGKSTSDIAKILNESSEIDLNTNEKWMPERIGKIVENFSQNKVDSSNSPVNSAHVLNQASGSIRTEQLQCFCPSCNRVQVEVISFTKGKCNHVLHLVLTLLTIVWVIAWLIKFLESQDDTKRNRRLAIADKKCSECGQSLIPLNE